MCQTTPLYFRSGTEFTGKPQTDEAGKLFTSGNGPCSRCGGQGGSQAWAYTGFVCYRCGGKNSMRFEFYSEKLYTAEQLEKMNTSLEARRERKAAKVAEEKAAKLNAALSTMDEETLTAYYWATSQPTVDFDEVPAGIARPLAQAQDIARKVSEFGPLTPAQCAFLKSLYNTVMTRNAEREAATPCPSGRVEITGIILSTKWVENNFGGAYKMVVKDDRGFRVYGTIPSSLGSSDKGDRVTFTATCEPSADDKLFGFYSRPTKATNPK